MGRKEGNMDIGRSLLDAYLRFASDPANRERIERAIKEGEKREGNHQ
jgi:hypothetical protein